MGVCFLYGIIIVTVAISISACSSSVDLPTKENSSTVTSTKSEGKTFGFNETATFKTLKITAKKLEESNGDSLFKPNEGNIFVGVNFEIENISDETQNISSILLFDAYSDDVKCDYAIMANTVFGDGTLDGELSPGKKLVGWYSVEVPQEWEKIDLEFKSDFLADDKVKFVFAK